MHLTQQSSQVLTNELTWSWVDLKTQSWYQVIDYCWFTGFNWLCQCQSLSLRVFVCLQSEEHRVFNFSYHLDPDNTDCELQHKHTHMHTTQWNPEQSWCFSLFFSFLYYLSSIWNWACIKSSGSCINLFELSVTEGDSKRLRFREVLCNRIKL